MVELLELYSWVLQSVFAGGSRAPIDWDERYKILLGVAQALAYLHNHAPIRVIHPNFLGFGFQDVLKSTSLIMLLFIRHLLSLILDRGFMPPEYILYGCLSTKTDVFSFGALIFEMGFFGAGRQLEEIAWRDWLAGIASNISDADSSKISRCIHIAVLCTEADVNDRPNMDAVIGMLLNTSDYHNLPLPKRPMLSWRIRDFSYNTKLDDYDVGG
ncbi:hypothetical protein OSB04_030890 [Centaurea solstitialis]|uniref:Serine-threonine/tyrosine-protein kinase catalytic domain-containing protein n=1 Tax=Centaurea solstitialis TaxID=347529 RepID=A0AA38VX41_9ASTR|nr:hypothetical protein OSB04_030890 [Centaurea solstitialis]